MAPASKPGLVVGVFASDKGPGDPERASLMSDVGRLFARKGGSIVCMAEGGIIPVPLVTAARAAGGHVEVLADASIVLPRALQDMHTTVLPDRAERLAHIGAKVACLVALPGSLASVTALFGAWSAAPHVPVVMLNRHKAFDVIRGFATDVMASTVPSYERHVQFADTVDDLWNKVAAISQRR